MATWVDDIVQALENLGGQAHRKQIFEEIRRIRKEPLPESLAQVIQRTIQDHSSDSTGFRGIDLFRKVGNGVWALRDQAQIVQMPKVISKIQAPAIKNYSSPESLDEITNVLRTIKQYRDYENPQSSTWLDYVKEFFHILGFSTKEVAPRLLMLNLIGSNHAPKAIVGLVYSGENFEEIIPGITWESYLTFAAHYYQINWGILTSGLQLKIIDFERRQLKQPSYWQDLDGIIRQEKIDTFCTIHKEVSFLKGNVYNAKQGGSSGKKNDKPRHEKYQSGRHVHHLEFWGQLLEKANEKTDIHANISPSKEYWISAGAGKTGLAYTYVIRTTNAQIELYIDRVEAEWNKQVFQYLDQHKEEIETSFGKSLEWQLLPDKRASRIRYLLPEYGLNDVDHWEDLQDRLIETMIRFEKALSPFIKQID